MAPALFTNMSVSRDASANASAAPPEIGDNALHPAAPVGGECRNGGVRAGAIARHDGDGRALTQKSARHRKAVTITRRPCSSISMALSCEQLSYPTMQPIGMTRCRKCRRTGAAKADANPTQ